MEQENELRKYQKRVKRVALIPKEGRFFFFRCKRGSFGSKEDQFSKEGRFSKSFQKRITLSQKRVTSKKLMQKRVGYHDTMENANATQWAAIQAILASNPATSALVSTGVSVDAPPLANNQHDSSGPVNSAGDVQELLKPKASRSAARVAAQTQSSTLHKQIQVHKPASGKKQIVLHCASVLEKDPLKPNTNRLVPGWKSVCDYKLTFRMQISGVWTATDDDDRNVSHGFMCSSTSRPRAGELAQTLCKLLNTFSLVIRTPFVTTRS